MSSGVVSVGGKNAALNVKFTNGGCEQFTVKPCSGSKVGFRLQFVIVQNGLEALENKFNRKRRLYVSVVCRDGLTRKNQYGKIIPERSDFSQEFSR